MVSQPLELVHLDYLTLEPSKGNIENVLVITDHFTRYALAYASKTQTAQATARILWDNFICHYGFPEQFISDQGRNFESDLIKELCKIAGVKKLHTTPYHPQSNGQCERFIPLFVTCWVICLMKRNLIGISPWLYDSCLQLYKTCLYYLFTILFNVW